VHILMISDVFFPRVNGVSTSIDTFRSTLMARGHRVTLICPAYPSTAQRTTVRRDDPDIIRISSRQVVMDPEDRMMNLREARHRGIELADIDLIHIHTPFVAHYAGVRLGRELDVPVVESYHTFFEEYLYNYVKWLPRSLLKFTARRFSASQCNAVDALVVPSTPMREILERYGVRTPMHTIPTGIDLERFRTPPTFDFRARMGIAPDRPMLLYVGRVALEKNIGFLIEMHARLLAREPAAVLVIAGEGPAERSLHRLVKQRGLTDSIRFAGYMRRDGELQDAYRAADLFVFSSRTETQGLVLIEALAVGTPVVALAAMGTRDVLDPEGGCVIAPDDPAGFATAVADTLADPDARRQRAADASAYVKSWSERFRADQLLALYGELIDSDERAARSMTTESGR